MEETTVTPAENQVKKKDHLKGKVIKLTLGGAVVDVGLDRPGFLHLTQIGDRSIKRIEDVLSEGQEIEVWVRKAGPGKDFIELTTSEPLAMEWRDLKKGMKVSGSVVKIEKFGAFVEIGAERPGLVHVSEMSHDFVRTPEEVVKVGETIDAMILDVDRKKRQIKLSMKALVDKPEAILHELNNEISEEEDNTPVPNAMEFALRAAMEKSQSKGGSRKKQSKGGNQALEDIFNRTLSGYKED